MNFLDWCLVVLTVAYALSGYWQGFITGAFATAGLLLGGLVGIWLAPILLGDAAPSMWVSLGALFVVLVMASLGQAVLQFAGTRIRAQDHLAADPGRRRGRRSGAERGRRAGGRLDARRGDQRLADPRHQPAGARLQGADRGQPGDAGAGPAGAAVLRPGRRLQLLPALPRAVRARADHQRRPRRAAGGARPRHPQRARRACSRSAAPTGAAAASRAPASSTPPTG